MQINKPTRYKINFFSRGENMPAGDPPPFKGLLEQHRKNLRMKQLRNWLGAGIGIVVVVTASILSYVLDKSPDNKEKVSPVAAVNGTDAPAKDHEVLQIDSSVNPPERKTENTPGGIAARRNATVAAPYTSQLIMHDSLPDPFFNMAISGKSREAGNMDAAKEEAPAIKAVKPPYRMWDVKFQKFHVNTDSTAVIIMPTGTKFTIPPHSLVDAGGNIIKGDIQIVCREFFDPVDIALAGIPMTYDSAGGKLQMETAGMFEIRGYWQGRPIRLMEGRTIKVYQASLGDDTYNTYYLDTVAGKWTYKGRPETRKIDVSSETGSRAGSRIKLQGVSDAPDKRILKKGYADKLSDGETFFTHAQMPKPKMRDVKNSAFKVAIDTMLFPELRGFKNMFFEIAPGQARVPNNKWVKMYVKRGALASSYTLVLVKGKSEYPYSAYPAFEHGEDYDRAMEVYKQYYQDILLQQANPDSMTRAARNRALEGALIIEAARKERMGAGQATEGTSRINDVEVWREFAISGFGIWNCDKLIRFPNVEKINIKVSISGQKTTEVQDIHVLAKQYNSIWLRQPMADNIYHIEYNRGDDVFIFAILPGTGRIAIIDSDDFRRQLALVRSGAQQGLQMTVVDEHFANSREVKAYILTRFLVDN